MRTNQTHSHIRGDCSDAPVHSILNLGPLAELDFAAWGLFWDCPKMSNARFVAMLSESNHTRHPWAWTRTLERLPSRVVTKALSLQDLRRVIRIVRLRPPLQRAWESAIEFWTQDAQRCFP
jgi:hypothetical protein